MTDRTNCLIVTLAEPMRDDDAEHIMDAIRCLQHVIDVRHLVQGPEEWAARMQERSRLRQAVLEAMTMTDEFL